jgi:hypothetical protein
MGDRSLCIGLGIEVFPGDCGVEGVDVDTGGVVGWCTPLFPYAISLYFIAVHLAYLSA